MSRIMDSLLFDKMKIGDVELKNRFFMSAAAISWNVTQENIPQDSDGYNHYEIAKGGVALIISGGLNVSVSGISNPKSGLFADERSFPFMSAFARKIKAGGALACLQITHGGMWAAQYAAKRGFVPFAPSFVVDGELGDYSISKRKDLPTSEEQIHEVIEAYGDAALRAKNCGFDAVEVHAAHESLLAQMLSPVSNLRKDRWGGSVENRCRFHCEVFKNARKKVGADFPVIVKLGVQDAIAGGLELKDGIVAAEIIAKAGDINAIEVSQGLSPGLLDFSNSSMRIGITSIEKEGYYRAWAREVKNAVKSTGILVIMQGGLRSFELMEEVVQKKEADLVSMCRPYIREPMLINRWISGDHKKATCISCNKCILKAIAEGKRRLECVLNKPNE